MLSTIEKYYTLSADITRLSPDSDSDFVEEYASHITGLPCYIEPYDDTYNEDLQGNFGKDFYLFCAPADIQEGDMITISSVKYKVVSLETYNTIGDNRHMEIKIRQSQE